MTLRRKLLAAFAGLALIALLVAGVALFATLRWQAATAEIETHYQRSLLLQRVRAGTFQALKEVDDALTGDHVDARADFERALQPTARDFTAWAALADNAAERAEVARVRAAHQRLIGNAERVFALAGTDRPAAVRLLDDEVDTNDYEQFRILTEQGVGADRARRRAVAAETERVRQTTQIMLAVSAISILSLVLLIAAYLSHDLFRPLRGLADTLDRLRLGDFKARADENRSDEIGAVAKSLNLFAASVERRGEPRVEGASNGGEAGSPLHGLATRLQARLGELRRLSGNEHGEILAELESLGRGVGRFAAMSLPLDLDLEAVDLAALAHSVVSRHRAALTERAVSLELTLAPDLALVLADRPKLREAISEAVSNALAALPERGGRLGLRVYAEAESVRLEVADDGRGMDGDLIERALGRPEIAGEERSRVGLPLARMIVERHGGGVEIFSEPGKGTVVRFSLPDRR